MLFSNKKATILFDQQVLDQVKDALFAIDAYPGAMTSLETEYELEAAIEKNPNLIIPFSAEDDQDSEFNLNMKKCRKPRATAKSK